MSLPIDQVPTPPTRDDPTNFDSRGDAFVASFPKLVTQMNEAIELVNNCIASINAAIAAGLANAANNATTATTQAGVATTQAGIATTKASEASSSAAAAAASVASIAGGAVASVNGLTGVVTGVAMQTGSDQEMTRQMFKDCGSVYYDSGTTNALNFVNGGHQRWAPNTGAQTLSIANWPPTGNLGELLIEGVNLGAATITWPTINWVKSDGTTTTTFSSNGVTLRTSGIDFVFLWTRDGGTTIYGKVMR